MEAFNLSRRFADTVKIQLVEGSIFGQFNAFESIIVHWELFKFWFVEGD